MPDDLFRYSFENRCLENNKPLGDETRKIFLNTRGVIRGNESEDLLNFLDFVENSNIPDGSEDTLLKQLQKRIDEVKKDRTLEGRYMTIGDLLNEERQEAREEAHKEILNLLAVITDEDRVILQNDFSQIDNMLEKYQIELS